MGFSASVMCVEVLGLMMRILMDGMLLVLVFFELREGFKVMT